MITLQDIQSALGRIRESIYLSPCARSETFSQSTGNQVYLKLDNLQRTGAFKERGALNKLLLLTAEERARGVIAASAGNHAQGVAYHAGKLGVRALICMPLTTPLIKVSATRGYGADVVLHGANYDEACEEALRRSNAESLTLRARFRRRRGHCGARNNWVGTDRAASRPGSGGGADRWRWLDWGDRVRGQRVKFQD
jgi:threonine dehydratase